MERKRRLEAVEAFIEAVRPAVEPGVLPRRLVRDLKVSSESGGQHQNLTTRAFPSLPYPLVVESVVVASGVT